MFPPSTRRASMLCCASQQVLKADTAPCALYDKTCKGKADNPNCLCGLVPALESSRRQGLWQRDVAAMLKLGPDPSASKREVRLESIKQAMPQRAANADLKPQEVAQLWCQNGAVYLSRATTKFGICPGSRALVFPEPLRPFEK